MVYLFGLLFPLFFSRGGEVFVYYRKYTIKFCVYLDINFHLLIFLKKKIDMGYIQVQAQAHYDTFHVKFLSTSNNIK